MNCAFLMSSVGAGAAAHREIREQCCSSDSSEDLSGLCQSHSCPGNSPESEGSQLWYAFPQLWIPPSPLRKAVLQQAF